MRAQSARTGPSHRAARSTPAGRRYLLLLALCLPVACVQAQNLTPHPQSILSRPLPGTLAREEHDLARSLEQALVGFIGVSGAHVLITGSEAQPSSPRRRAAVQLALTDDCRPGAEWTGAVADFILQAVPDLTATELTIVDASGRTLYSAGAARAAPPGRTAAQAAVPLSVGAWPLLLAAALGVVLGSVALLLRRGGRRGTAPQVPVGPFGFLHELSERQLMVALGGERPAVVSAVLGRLPRETAARAARALGLRLLPEDTPEVPAEVLGAMAEALRRKLTEAGLR